MKCKIEVNTRGRYSLVIFEPVKFPKEVLHLTNTVKPQSIEQIKERFEQLREADIPVTYIVIPAIKISTLKRITSRKIYKEIICSPVVPYLHFFQERFFFRGPWYETEVDGIGILRDLENSNPLSRFENKQDIGRLIWTLETLNSDMLNIKIKKL